MTGQAIIEVHREVGWCDDGINGWTLVRSAQDQSIAKVSQIHDVARLSVTESGTSNGAGWRKEVPGSLSTNDYPKCLVRLKGGGNNPQYEVYVHYTDATNTNTGQVSAPSTFTIVTLNLPQGKTVDRVEIYVHSNPNQSAYLDVDYIELVGREPLDILPKVERARVELQSSVAISRFHLRLNNQETPFFADDFGGDLSQWTVNSGTWQIENGELSGQGVSGQQYILGGDVDWTDFIYEARFKLYSGADSGVAVRVQGVDNHYLVALRVTSPTVELYKRVGGAYTSLASANPTMATEKWYTVRVKVKDEGTGVRLQVYLDDTLQISHLEDPKTFSSGKVGMRVNGTSHAHFDDPRVYSPHLEGTFFPTWDIHIGDHVKIYFADEDDAYALWEKILAGRVTGMRVGRDEDGKEYMDLEGFDYGLYLLDRRWTKEYTTEREVSLILKDALAEKVPEITTTGVYATSVTVKNNYKEKDILQLVKDIAAIGNSEWYVDPAADLDFYAIGQATVEGGLSPLKEGGKLRDLTWEENLDDIANHIKLYIFEGQYTPHDQDAWTENVADWSSPDPTDGGFPNEDVGDLKSGNASIKFQTTNPGSQYRMRVVIPETDMEQYKKLRFWFKYGAGLNPENLAVKLTKEGFDSADSYFYKDGISLPEEETWEEIEVDLDTLIKHMYPSNAIKKIEIRAYRSSGDLGSGGFKIDGLRFAHDPEYVISEDTDSQNAYSKREKTFVDKTITNLIYAQNIADAYRDWLKFPLRHVTAITDGSMWFRPAQTIVLDVPSRGAYNTKYRVIKAIHVFEQGKDYFCELELIASRSPVTKTYSEKSYAKIVEPLVNILDSLKKHLDSSAIGGTGVIIR